MKIWYTYADEHKEELVNQLLMENKVKLLQGEYDYLFTLDTESIGIVFYNGVDVLFYVLVDDYVEEELLMFRDDFRLLDGFYNELFYCDFSAWLNKVRGLIEENKKWLN
jgi:hypothetical protein